jgi:hypothetical protein
VSGVLLVRRGVLVHAETGGANGDAAAIEIVAWQGLEITISGSNDSRPATVVESLGFIVLESMRVQDERLRGSLAHEQDGPPSGRPERRTFRPTGPPRGSQPPPDSVRRNPEYTVPTLQSGARLMALVDGNTGAVLHFTAANGTPVEELARNACQLLEQELATLRLCNAEGLEELVLSTTSRCDVIRPLPSNEFALLVFAPEDTNLVMARLELEQFIAGANRGRNAARESATDGPRELRT